MPKIKWFNRISAKNTALAAGLLAPVIPVHALSIPSASTCPPISQPTHWQQSVLAQALESISTSNTHTVQPVTHPYRFHADHILGTSLDIIALAPNKDFAQRAYIAAKTKISQLDAILSTYRRDSELNTLNATSQMVVSQDLFNVIQACEHWREKTNQAFSGRLGTLLQLWSDAALNNQNIDPENLYTEVARLNLAQITLDETTRTISRPDDIIFALDALAKGYIIDEALEAARIAAPHVTGLMIDIGGDIRFWGQSPHTDGWRVGLPQPLRTEDNASIVTALKLNNKAIATSGKGARDIQINGYAYSHILSPKSGWPAERIVRATVIADTAADADALATAFTVMAPEDSLRLANHQTGVEALLITDDGHIMTSDGWQALNTHEDDHPHWSLPSAADMLYTSAPNEPAATTTSLWPVGFTVNIDYEVPRIEADIYRAPYVSIWVTDENKHIVRTLSLLGNNSKYLNENYVWWRRYGRKQANLDTITKPTRQPGRYTLSWDGLDDSGRPVGQGHYVLHIEATREHGGHTYQSVDLNLTATPFNKNAPAKEEMGNLTLRYGKGKNEVRPAQPI